jgi:hypothetical protein
MAAYEERKLKAYNSEPQMMMDPRRNKTVTIKDPRINVHPELADEFEKIMNEHAEESKDQG